METDMTKNTKLEISQDSIESALDTNIAEETRPQLSHEQYLSLATLRDRQHLLKSRGYDLKSFAEEIAGQIETAKTNFADQIAQAEAQRDEALRQLGEIKGELDSTTDELRTKFVEYMQPYGIENENLQVEETEPHYITVVQPPQAEAAE